MTNNPMFLQALINRCVPIPEGHPKSDAMRQAAKQHGLPVVDVPLHRAIEPRDILGFPLPVE